MRRTLAVLVAVFSGLVNAGGLPDCAVSMYHVNEAGAIGSEPFVVSRHVVRVEPYKDVLGEVFPEIAQWLVTLNREGAEIMRGYTDRNMGSRLAIFCNGAEVSRPVIRSVVREQLVFGVRKEGQ